MSVWAFLELCGQKDRPGFRHHRMVLALGFLISAGSGFIASAIYLNVGRFMPVAWLSSQSCWAWWHWAVLPDELRDRRDLFSVFDRLRAGLTLASWPSLTSRLACRAGRAMPVPRRGVRAGHRWVSDRGIRLLGGVGVLGCLFGGGAGHLWCGGVESPTGIPAYPGCGQRRYVRGVSE